MLFDFLNSAREPISKVDTAWLRMERPTNLMMITGVMTFREAVDFDRLVRVIRTRFLSFKRFNQRAVDRSGNAYWEVDPNFDIWASLLKVRPGANLSYPLALRADRVPNPPRIVCPRGDPVETETHCLGETIRCPPMPPKFNSTTSDRWSQQAKAWSLAHSIRFATSPEVRRESTITK